MGKIQAAICLAVVAGLFAAGCGLDPGESNSNENDGDRSVLSVSVDQQRQIEAIVDEIMQSQQVPGVVVGIWQGDKEPYILTRGLADVAGGRQIAADDRYRIGDVSKTFEAIIIFQLCDQGKMSLDDPISKFLPDFPGGQDISVLQLLNMTAGIYDVTGDQAFAQKYYGQPATEISREEVYGIICQGKSPYHPGERCVYTDANYLLLERIIEQVSGNPVDQEIKARICDPLGLTTTELPSTALIAGQYSKGYRVGSNGNLEEVAVHPSYARAAGAMVSNLYDMKVYVKALYDGRLISSYSLKTMQTWRLMTSYPNRFPHTRYSNIDIFYGSGLMSWGGLIGHNGTILGYNTMVGYIPQKDATIIIWANKCDDIQSETPPVALMQDRIVNILYGEEYPFMGLPGI